MAEVSKVCTMCSARRRLVDFHKQILSPDRRSSWCKLCRSKKDKLRYRNNAPKIREKVCAYWWKNRETRLIKQRAYYQKNRERLLEQRRKYCMTPRGKALSFIAHLKRRERIGTDLRYAFLVSDWLKVMNKFLFRCFNCGQSASLTIDHHQPVVRGGKSLVSNAVVLCKSCNSSKNDLPPCQFYTSMQIKRLQELGVPTP